MSKSFFVTVATAGLVLSSAGYAAEMEGPGITNFVNAEVGGWHLQCSLQLVDYQSPARCLALFDLSDGNVVLRYSNSSLQVATMGTCGMGESGGAVPLPVTDVAKLIEDSARKRSQNCNPPILTAELFQSVPELNTIATLLVQRRPQ